MSQCRLELSVPVVWNKIHLSWNSSVRSVTLEYKYKLA